MGWGKWGRGRVWTEMAGVGGYFGEWGGDQVQWDPPGIYEDYSNEEF